MNRLAAVWRRLWTFRSVGRSFAFKIFLTRIGADDFEVGTDVLDAMKARLPDAASRFKPKAEAGKWLCDLAGLASDALVSEGVKREDIADCGFSTYADPVHFFSYRRDHGETGRHAALVRIEPKAL